MSDNYSYFSKLFVFNKKKRDGALFSLSPFLSITGFKDTASEGAGLKERERERTTTESLLLLLKQLITTWSLL